MEDHLEKAYKNVETIEDAIAEIDLTLLEFEVLREAYDGWAAEMPYSKEKVEWLIEVNDYFNWVNNVTVIAEYNRHVLQEKLEQARAKIDSTTEGGK